jgi:TetR/AcrR family transcriptional regulator, transcriptional repressor for nem operon
MPKPKYEHPRERIMDIAEHLIMSRGFNRFSYKDISTEMNVKNAAIHYYFPSKDDLGVAVIRRAHARCRKWNETTIRKTVSPVDMLNVFLEMFTGYLNSGEYVCLASSLETDFNTFSKEMQNEIRVYAAEMHNWVRNLLERGREEGLFTFSDSPEDKAFFILSSIQGALEIARVSDKKRFYRFVDKIKTELVG